MRVLIANTLYTPNLVGGAERSVQVLAEALVEGGHQVTVATVHADRRAGRANRNGVEVHYLPNRNIYWPFGPGRPSRLLKPLWHVIDARNPLMAREVGRIMDDFRPDVFHTNNLGGLSTCVWGEAGKRRIPIVHTLRDYSLLCPASTMFRHGKNCDPICAQCRPFHRLKRGPSRNVHTVVGNSRFILERHLRFGMPENPASTAVIYNACPAPPPDYRRVPPWPGSGPRTIGYLGQLHPTKGIECLIDAVREMGSERARLLIAGRGSEEYTAHLRSRAGGSATFLGVVDKVDFFRRIDVLVVPSLWHEPLARTVIEALVFDVPLIVSRVGGSIELHRQWPSIEAFDPGDPESLRNTLERNFNRGIPRLDTRQDAIREVFSPRRMVANHEKVYLGAVHAVG